MQKKLLVELDGKSVKILVPKKKGPGFLLSPLGHHPTAARDLADEIGCPVLIQDGHLELAVGHYPRLEDGQILRDYVAPVARHIGLPFTVVSEAEFWGLNRTSALAA